MGDNGEGYMAAAEAARPRSMAIFLKDILSVYRRWLLDLGILVKSFVLLIGGGVFCGGANTPEQERPFSNCS